uniref:ATP synthase F0 subunit 8 n=1 Tax=Phraortes sp. 1 NS-2020 TaxID=2783691 RepID=A0A7T3FAP9_9NEOP|nr:ATP synthase F0 subunit 8 [Phraortes sp. 1 NS-2020]
MPQMAPMSWIIIYMLFIMITMMFNMKIYFHKSNKLTKEFKNNNKMIDKTWKW